MRRLIAVLTFTFVSLVSLSSQGSLLTDTDGIDLYLDDGSGSNRLGPDFVTQNWNISSPTWPFTTFPAPMSDGSEIELTVMDFGITINQVNIASPITELFAWALSITDIQLPGGTIQGASLVSSTYPALSLSFTPESLQVQFSGEPTPDGFLGGEYFADIALVVGPEEVSEPRLSGLLIIVMIIMWWRQRRAVSKENRGRSIFHAPVLKTLAPLAPKPFSVG